MLVVVVEVGEEPGKDAEDEGSAEELEDAEKGVEALQGEPSFGRHFGIVDEYAGIIDSRQIADLGGGGRRIAVR